MQLKAKISTYLPLSLYMHLLNPLSEPSLALSIISFSLDIWQSKSILETQNQTETQMKNMNNQILLQALGIPVGSIAYQAERTPKRLLQASPNGSPKLKQSKVDIMNKLGGKEDNLAYGIRDHVRLGPKISETVKGKLSLGAKILQAGGVEKIFKHHFSVGQEEKLLKASQCYLSTTAGPIAGLFFISTDRIAFCSERSIKFSTPTGELIRIHYKVMIPVRKILRADESQNMKRPSRKYIEIVTVDNFDFWFMGFLNYRKTFTYLQQAISQFL